MAPFPLPQILLRDGRVILEAGGVESLVWDALWNGVSPGRFAVDVNPNAERLARIKGAYRVKIDEPSGTYPDEWRQSLTDQLYTLAAKCELPGDHYPALCVPRGVHGQSQGITDLFGARVEAQPDGNYFPYPLPPDPDVIDAVVPAPIDTSMYWGAVEWVRYARAATGGALAFRHPVMTGPLDTVNYLLGTTVLLEWVYSEPETVHRLLAKVTDVLIAVIHALRAAAGGALCPGLCSCMRGGFDLCSEMRSIISLDTYEEFEAPYLRRIGEEAGDYAVHSCGSFERTIPSALRDPHCRAMNGQVRENDLALLCELTTGKITLSINPSVNLHERYTWPDSESYFCYVLSIVPSAQPLEVSMMEDDLPLWRALHREIRGEAFGVR
ncbi:MAG: uroporphyrinogen decarboxylase family protein [Armatimonadota bacterium]